MTLCASDKDPAGAGKSVCHGQCAANWPPLKAEADARAPGQYVVIARDDGTRQWSYRGRPLYFRVDDSRPGHKTGDGVNRTWRTGRL